MTKEYTIKVGEVFTQEKADELIEYLRMKDEEILKGLDRIEERLKLSGGNVPISGSFTIPICEHEWEDDRGTTGNIMRCRKCGATRFYYNCYGTA